MSSSRLTHVFFNAKTSPVTIPLLYAILSSAWIVASDSLLNRWGHYFGAQTLKGVLFVAVTAALLHSLILRRDQTLRSAEQRASTAERMRTLGELAARISHDMNNVLMCWRMTLPRLRRHLAETPEGLKLIEQLASAEKRGAKLTAEILAFANPHTVTYDSILLSTWLSACTAEFNTTLSQGISVTADVDPITLALDADEAQLHRLLTNLVFNAAEAMAHPGAIRITAKLSARNPALVDLAVADRGCGIPPEIAARIFDPLVTTKRCGTGLGLAIVDRIATQHRGSVFFDSHPGVGTTFHVLLPVKQTQCHPLAS